MTTLIDHFPNAGCYAPQPLVKASGRGEGSRGGKIIGHTKSGKPVYLHGNPGDHPYRGFSHQDHLDAAQIHRKQMSTHTRARSRLGDKGPDPSLHLWWAGLHEAMQHAHIQAAGHALSEAEGSHGGHFIGHTKSEDQSTKTESSQQKATPRRRSLGKTSSGKSITSAQGYPDLYKPVRGDHLNQEHGRSWGAHLTTALPNHSALDHLEASVAHEKQRQSLLKQGRWGEAHASELASIGHAHAARIAKD